MLKVKRTIMIEAMLQNGAITTKENLEGKELIMNKILYIFICFFIFTICR